MKKKRLLLTGCNGLLGANVVFQKADTYDIVATSRSKPVSSKDVAKVDMDVTDAYQVAKVMGSILPDVVVHCAALTNVDDCEDDPARAELVNAIGTRNIAEAAKDTDASVVFISTDSVFEGKRGGYTETDATNPVNEYSKSKLLGEKYLQEVGGRHLILRTNMFGWNMQDKFSLSEWILNSLRRGEPIGGFTDVYFSPLLVNQIADIGLQMYEVGLEGVYHIGTRGSLSKFDFACRIADLFGLNTSLIHKSLLTKAKFKAPRPLNTSLDVGKANKDTGNLMPSIEEQLKQFYQLERDGYVSALKCRGR